MERVLSCRIDGDVDNADGADDSNELQNQGVHQERHWILNTVDSAVCDHAVGAIREQPLGGLSIRIGWEGFLDQAITLKTRWR
jgi:hypothetical protein